MTWKKAQTTISGVRDRHLTIMCKSFFQCSSWRISLKTGRIQNEENLNIKNKRHFLILWRNTSYFKRKYLNIGHQKRGSLQNITGQFTWCKLNYKASTSKNCNLHYQYQSSMWKIYITNVLLGYAEIKRIN